MEVTNNVLISIKNGCFHEGIQLASQGIFTSSDLLQLLVCGFNRVWRQGTGAVQLLLIEHQLVIQQQF